jgi:hypothetical protein
LRAGIILFIHISQAHGMAVDGIKEAGVKEERLDLSLEEQE